MYKTYKFRLYPDKKQQILLNKIFGCSRFIYNHYLSNIKSNGYKDACYNISDYVNNLKYEYFFLQEVDSTIIRKTLFHLDDNKKIIIMDLVIQNIKVDMIDIVILLVQFIIVIKIKNIVILK